MPAQARIAALQNRIDELNRQLSMVPAAPATSDIATQTDAVEIVSSGCDDTAEESESAALPATRKKRTRMLLSVGMFCLYAHESVLIVWIIWPRFRLSVVSVVTARAFVSFVFIAHYLCPPPCNSLTRAI